jgi:hypothetical protein
MRKRKEKKRPLQLIERNNIEKSKTEKEKKNNQVRYTSDNRSVPRYERTSSPCGGRGEASNPIQLFFVSGPNQNLICLPPKLIKTLYMCRCKCDLSAVIFSGSKEIREISHANGQSQTLKKKKEKNFGDRGRVGP